MGRIKAMILWKEEVLDEIYSHLSEVDREFLPEMYVQELESTLEDWFRDGLTVEQAATKVLQTLQDMKHDVRWEQRVM